MVEGAGGGGSLLCVSPSIDVTLQSCVASSCNAFPIESLTIREEYVVDSGFVKMCMMSVVA